MQTGLFDTHCHLTSSELLGQTDCILADAWSVGVSRILAVACRPEEFEPVLALVSASPAPAGRQSQAQPCSAESARGERPTEAKCPPAGRPALWAATGIHPHEAAKAQPRDWDALASTWRHPKVVAAGEMGLDYHYDFSPRDVQRVVFERQLDLAAAAGLPVIIHCREAHADVIEILVHHGFDNRPVVFHCFSGTPEEAAELRAHGWWTSFTGVITFKNAASVRQACIETPPDQLMFETDSPYLSPEPVRRMRPNRPQTLAHTARFAAQLRGEEFDELAVRSTANAWRFFRL